MTYTEQSIAKMRAKSVANNKSTLQALKAIQKYKPKSIDRFFHAQHAVEFSCINCLECANCCKSISPAMYESDVRRMAAFTKMKVPEFIETYLNLDEEEEYVFKNAPCPFLGDDNYCSIYPSRPRACREYPHTDRQRIYQILDLTARNSKVCPAVYNIIDTLKKTPTIS